MTRTRADDDFAAIRKRMEELRREHIEASTYPETTSPMRAELDTDSDMSPHAPGSKLPRTIHRSCKRSVKAPV